MDFVEEAVSSGSPLIDHFEHPYAGLHAFVDGFGGVVAPLDHGLGVGREIFEGPGLGACLGDDGFEHLGVSREGSGIEDSWREEDVFWACGFDYWAGFDDGCVFGGGGVNRGRGCVVRS